MAILKHLASKSADYGRALEYVMFQHDEEGRLLLDENGHRMQRKEYYLDGINCDPFLFDAECRMVNRQYHKNKSPGEIKSHHYILSFDPRDAAEGKLTGERAQALAMEFAKKYFPGHQAIVCTHTDGHNESGNIHTHIIINSVRKLDVSPDYFTERPCDSRAGYKHHLTDQYREHLHHAVMDMCLKEGLHQVDLLGTAREHITDKEYHAKQRGQRKLDQLNQEITEAGLKPARTVFQTQKQFIRDAVEDISRFACSEEEFILALKEKYGITCKDHRGRFSYLHPDRSKFVTGRALGSDYEKEALLAKFESNRTRDIQKQTPSTEPKKTFDTSADYHADPVAILYVRSHLRLVTDLQTCIKAQQSQAYARKVKLSNLKEMAKTVVYIQEHGYDTQDALTATRDEARHRFAAAEKALVQTDAQIRLINEQIHYAGQYLATRQVQGIFLKAANKKQFRAAHLDELEKYNAARKYFKEHRDGSIPSLKELKEERAKLQAQRKQQSTEREYYYAYQKELDTACSNVEAILHHPDRTLEKGKKYAQGIE